MCVITLRHSQNIAVPTPEPVTKKQFGTEVNQEAEKINLKIKDTSDVTSPKKSSLSDKELVKLVDETCVSCNGTNDKYYDETVKLTGSLLSAVDIPIITAPVKLASDFVSMDKSTETFAKNIQEKNYLNLATSSVSSVKDSWGTLISGAKFVEVVADAGANYGFLPSKASAVIGKQVSKFSTTASKISLPFAVLGIALSGVDFAKEVSKVSDRKKLLKDIQSVKSESSIRHRGTLIQAEDKVKNDIKVIKVNAGIKGTSFALSAISTSALIMSVKNPQKAKTYLTISVVSSIASGVTSVFSDAGYRRATGNFVADKKDKLLNLVH